MTAASGRQPLRAKSLSVTAIAAPTSPATIATRRTSPNFDYASTMNALPPGFWLDVKPSLSEKDRKEIFGWDPDIFGVAALPTEWRLKDLHFIAYDGSYAASHVGTIIHTVEVGGEPVTVCGIGGVTTRPEYQGQGIARALLSEALTHNAASSDASFGFLFCFPRLVRYYRELGWTHLEVPVLVEQTDGEIPAPVEAMVLPLRDAAWPAGNVRALSRPW